MPFHYVFSECKVTVINIIFSTKFLAGEAYVSRGLSSAHMCAKLGKGSDHSHTFALPCLRGIPTSQEFQPHTTSTMLVGLSIALQDYAKILQTLVLCGLSQQLMLEFRLWQHCLHIHFFAFLQGY